MEKAEEIDSDFFFTYIAKSNLYFTLFQQSLTVFFKITGSVAPYGAC